MHGAWIVVPRSVARTAAALERLLDRVAGARGLELLAVSTSSGPAWILRTFGAELLDLARTMSVLDAQIALLRVVGPRGVAIVFRDGTEIERVVGTAAEAVRLTAGAIEGSEAELVAALEAHDASAEVRAVRWNRPHKLDPQDPKLTWYVRVDDAMETEWIACALTAIAPQLRERFERWVAARKGADALLRTDDVDQDDDEAAAESVDAASIAIIGLCRATLGHVVAIEDALSQVLVAGGRSPNASVRTSRRSHRRERESGVSLVAGTHQFQST